MDVELVVGKHNKVYCAECDSYVGHDGPGGLGVGLVIGLEEDGFFQTRVFCNKKHFDAFYAKNPQEKPIDEEDTFPTFYLVKKSLQPEINNGLEPDDIYKVYSKIKEMYIQKA